MAIQGPLKVSFGEAFPFGAFVVGPVEPVRDFDASKGGAQVQARDKATGEPLWQVDVLDADPSARERTVRVKIAAPVQPVPPAAADGVPFTAVEFDGLTVTPYVKETGMGRGRLAFSLRARPGCAQSSSRPARPRRSRRPEMTRGGVLAAVVANLAAYLLLVVGLVWACRLTVRWARGRRGWRERRRQIRCARQVVRGWPALAQALGLTVVEPARWSWTRCRPRPARTLIPAVSVRPTGDGVVVDIACIPGVSLHELTARTDHLANAWGCQRVTVEQTGPGWLRAWGMRVDPLTHPYAVPLPSSTPALLERLHLGRDQHGQSVTVRLANVAGIVVQGLPGYGKTTLICHLLRQLLGSAAVQLAVVDGKGGPDYDDLAPRCWLRAGDDLADALAVVEAVHAGMVRRQHQLRAALGVKNLWQVGPSERWPLIVLVIDEAHTFFYTSAKGAAKEDLERSHRMIRLVEQLVKKGRNVGLLTILATQRGTADAIPTSIRDICSVRVTFAVASSDAAVAALGVGLRDHPEADPQLLQDPAYVGVAVTQVEGRPGFTRVRVPQVDDQELADLARATSSLTADPARLLAPTAVEVAS
jgi:S-DNA-T family DNA segregation ATPase FtsK/SpoIIIE